MSGIVIAVAGFIAFWIALAIAVKHFKPKNEVSTLREISGQKRAEPLAGEQPTPPESQAETDERAREQRARGRAAIQRRIDALTKEQDERKVIAEKMTTRLDVTRPDVPLAVPPVPRLLQDKYPDLIERFYELAEWKVSLRDEYGDENWEALDKEINAVIKKIAQREVAYLQSDRWKDSESVPGMLNSPSLLNECSRLRDFLKQTFRDRYLARQSRQIDHPVFAMMSGQHFEAYVMDLLGRLGYDVHGTRVTGDQGADIVAEKDGKRIVIQAKNYSSTVGNEAVQQVAAAVRFYTGDEGWVVTNSTFTRAARELAQCNNVKLVDGIALQRMVDDGRINGGPRP
jgi:HJR/Mrr/RecB family endonuclease